MMDDLERAVLEAGGGGPDAALRERVLAASMPLVHAHPSRLDRLWFSTGWRLAAAAALFAISGAEMLSPEIGSLAVTAESQQRLTDSASVTAWAARQIGLTSQETMVVVAQAIEAPRSRE